MQLSGVHIRSAMHNGTAFGFACVRTQYARTRRCLPLKYPILKVGIDQLLCTEANYALIRYALYLRRLYLVCYLILRIHYDTNLFSVQS